MATSAARRKRALIEAAVLVVVIAVSAFAVFQFGKVDEPSAGAVTTPQESNGAEIDVKRVELGSVSYDRLANPARTVARTKDGDVLASMTDGARTAVVYGKKRRLDERKSYAGAPVDTSAYVRLMPEKWQRGAQQQSWFRDWLKSTVDSKEPDILEIALQYTDDAPAEKDDSGLRIAGDATFGPPDPTDPIGMKQESDFYDYLGVDWDFGDGDVEKPEKRRYGSLDCSGFVRMVYGYRGGYPLTSKKISAKALPRRVGAISTVGPGVDIVADKGVKPSSMGALQAGDLVFFNNDPATAKLDHMAIYLGKDAAGHHRFISSRAKINGPTMSDVGGASTLDGQGLYPDSWRAAKRL